MISTTLTAAKIAEALLAFSPAMRAPDWDADPMLVWRRRVSGRIAMATPKLLAMLVKDPPHFAAADLGHVFGNLDSSHAFHVAPLDWGMRLTEPQATGALAHLLSHPHREIKAQRVKAFLHALGMRFLDPDTYDFGTAEITAERLIKDNRRIDLELLLPWTRSHATPSKPKYRAILVEAKFNHKITSGQLSAYRRHQQKFEHPDIPETPDGDLIVLGLCNDRSLAKHLTRNSSWRFLSWRTLLVNFERALPAAADDANFRLFRRTIWDRVGGMAPRK
jgi:hypothetical protein